MYYLIFLCAKLINHYYLCCGLHHTLLGVELKEERPWMNSLIQKQQFLSCKWGSSWALADLSWAEREMWVEQFCLQKHMRLWLGGWGWVWGVMFLVFHSRFSYRSDFTAHEFSWTSLHLPLSKYYVAFVWVF